MTSGHRPAAPADDENVTAFWQALGLPGLADVHVHFPHVALDTTMAFTGFFDELAPFPRDLLPRVRDLGLAGKVLLGTDFPNIPHRYAEQIAALARLDLGADWLRAVCWDNPLRLLGDAHLAPANRPS